MKPLVLIIGILTVIFSVGDLIGKDNLDYLEKHWLGLSRQVFKTWKESLTTSATWWKTLLKISASMLVGSILVTLLLRYWVTSFGSGKVLIAEFIFVFGVIVLHFWISNFTQELTDIDDNPSLPSEINLIRDMLKPYKVLSETFDKLSNTSAARGLPILLAIAIIPYGVIISTVTIVAILLRLVIFLCIFPVWLIGFAPSQLLNKIAEKTGAEGYFNVAKYVLLAIGIVIAWLID